MNVAQQIAKHFREIHFGGNWTESDIRSQLADVTWEEAIARVYDLNTIAMLTYHIHYYVATVLNVLQGGALEGSDKNSFDHPPIASESDWENLRQQVMDDAGIFARLLDELPENRLWENIGPEKYGSYYRNLHGIIEHSHYHLGQIALIRKIIRQRV